jgi:hypothetical protein
MNHKPPVSVDDPAVRVRFVHALSKLGNVAAAAALTRVSVGAFYIRRRTDKAFAAEWDDALMVARDTFEDALRRRALEGIEHKVYRNGREISATRKFSDRLGIYVHQVLDRRAQKIEQQRDAQQARQEAQRIETMEPLELARRILFLLREAAGKVRDSGDAAGMAEIEQMLFDAGFRPDPGS